jgi:serine/threonine-protein kinase
VDPHDKHHKVDEVAARIADGSDIDWVSAESTSSSPHDRALLDQLRTIADVATLHLTPDEWSAESERGTPANWGMLSILSSVGAGRFGEVFLAWDARLQRRVALKLLHAASPSLASPTRAIEEARLLARVRHPNVLAVYGAECLSDQVGIWTEFIEGLTLEAILAERGPLLVDEVIAIGIDLCRALAAVHDAGLLHRDVKAQNVMRETGGRIVLMDFGTGYELARVTPREGDLSGTPLYLAPELFRGASPSAATDVYAVGVLLFRLLTGRYPVPGRTLEEVRAEHAAQTAVSLRSLRPDTPGPLAEAIERALAQNPDHRFQSAREFERNLTPLRAVARERSGRWLAWRLGMGAASVLTVVGLLSWALGWGSSVGSPIVREVQFGTFQPLGPPSADGRLFPVFASRFASGVANLFVIDVTGTDLPRRVDDPLMSNDPGGGISRPAAISPDNSQIVYSLVWPKHNESEIRVLDLRTFKSELKYRGPGALFTIGWAPSQSRVLIEEKQSGEATFSWLDLISGTLAPFKTIAAMPETVTLSPDGRYVAYDLPVAAGPGSTQWDVFIADTTNGQIHSSLTSPSQEAFPTWLPDGSGIVFASDRSGGLGLWQQRVLDGETVGQPALIRAKMGIFRPVGFDRSRTLYYTSQGQVDVYTARIDLRGGGVSGEAVVPATFMGNNAAPSWSPDGSRLLYVTDRAEVPGARGQDLALHDFRSGSDQLIPLSVRGKVRELHWSPDGDNVLFPGSASAGQGLYMMHLPDGQLRPVSLGLPAPVPSFSPAGDFIFYLDRAAGDRSEEWSINTLNPITGDKQKVLDCPDCAGYALSRDGEWMAWTTFASVGPFTVGVSDLVRGTKLRLEQRPEGAVFEIVGWSPDGRELIVATRGIPPGGHVEGAELLAFEIPGGARRSLGWVHAEGARSIVLNPAGTEIAFEAGWATPRTWLMRGFIEAERTQR